MLDLIYFWNQKLWNPVLPLASCVALDMSYPSLSLSFLICKMGVLVPLSQEEPWALWTSSHDPQLGHFCRSTKPSLKHRQDGGK